MNARRAVWRWGWRLLCKDWRDQVLILGLIGGVVALSVAGAVLGYNAASPGNSVNEGTFIRFEGEQADIDRAVAYFGDDLGPLGRGQATIDGSTQQLTVNAFDPDGPVTGTLITMLDGQFPEGQSQIGVTKGALALLAAELGDTVTLDGNRLTVVGIVEDPTKLDAEFAFLDHRDSAPLPIDWGYKTLLDASVFENGLRDELGLGPSFGMSISSNQTSLGREGLTFISTTITTIAMLLVGLIASAAFAVVARRRVRQFGLLGAIGADERHLRGAAAFNGFAVGVLSALPGAILGVVIARAAMPLIETSFNHRLGFEAPLRFILPPALLAIAMATIAAWWPARALSRQPIVDALAARRPEQRSVRNTTAVGIIIAVGGYLLLNFKVSPSGPTLASVAGILLAALGVLLLTPAVISGIGAVAGRAPLPVRIAGRDLARFQSRAVAALCAVVVALAIPAGVGLVTASIDAKRVIEPRNLDDNTAIVWADGVGNDGHSFVPIELVSGADTSPVDAVTTAIPSLSATPIEVVIDPNVEPWSPDGRLGFEAIGSLWEVDCDTNYNTEVGDDNGRRCYVNETSWVANTELTALWSLDLQGVDSDVLVRETGPRFYWNGNPAAGGDFAALTQSVAPLPDYSSFAKTLLTEDTIEPNQQRVTVGWILSNPSPLTPDEIVTMRSAVDGAANVETLSEPAPQTNIRTTVALIGMVIGLAILAATVTLIRGESADDTRVMNQLGASAMARRTVAGSTAALLALGGAILAIPLGGLGLIIERASTGPGGVGSPVAVPWSTIAILCVVFPIAAAIASGLFASNPKEIR